MPIPDIKTFNQLGDLMIQRYERYLPTAFDDSLSMLEKVNKVIEYVNETGRITNELIEFVEMFSGGVHDSFDEFKSDVNQTISDFLNTYESSLSQTVINTLEEWQTTGKLDIVISGALTTRMDDLEEQVNTQLSQIVYNVKALGVNADGTDETVVINNILNSLPSGSHVIFPTDEYIGDIRINKPLHVDFMGSTITSPTNNIDFVSFRGSISTTKRTLANPLKRYDTTIRLSTEPVDITAGDLIMVRDDTSRPSDGLPNINTEVHKVKQVDGYTITIEDFIHLPKNIAENNVSKITPLKGVSAKNLVLKGDLANVSGKSGISFVYCEDVEIENIKMTENIGAAIVVSGCYRTHINNFEINHPLKWDGGEGYGVLTTGGTSNFIIENGSGIGNRHLIDNAQCFNGLVENVKAYSNKSASITLSHNSYDTDCTFKNCHVYDSEHYAFYFGNQGFTNNYDAVARNINVIDCSAHYDTETYNSVGVMFNALTDSCMVNNFTFVIGDGDTVSTNGIGVRYLPRNSTLMVDGLTVKGALHGVFAQNTLYPITGKNKVSFNNISFKNCKYGFRTLNAENIYAQNVFMVNVETPYYLLTSVNEKMNGLTLKDFYTSNTNTTILVNNDWIKNNSTEGKISNWISEEYKPIKTITHGWQIRLNDIITSKDGVVVLKASEPVGSNSLLPISYPLFDGQQITLLNASDVNLTLSPGENLQFKVSDPVNKTINPYETVTFVFYDGKWFEV